MNLIPRMQASLARDAINGDALERAVCEAQMREAVRELVSLRNAATVARDALERAASDPVWPNSLKVHAGVPQALETLAVVLGGA